MMQQHDNGRGNAPVVEQLFYTPDALMRQRELLVLQLRHVEDWLVEHGYIKADKRLCAPPRKGK